MGCKDRRVEFPSVSRSSLDVQSASFSEGRSKDRRTRAYDMLRRSNFHGGLEGDTSMQKQKALDQKWAEAAPVLRAHYEASAEAEYGENTST